MTDHLEKRISDFIDSIGIFGVIIEKMIVPIIIVIVGYIFMKILLHIVRKIMDRTKLEKVLYSFVENTIKIVCWACIIITVLSIVGVPTTTFVTVIGACGAAVALALRDSLSNFAGGILVMINKPFATDDLIEMVEVSDTLGRVKRIDLLYSTLTTPDNQIIIIPNGMLANHVVVNHSRADRRRIDCKFNISYISDIDIVREILKKIIDENPIFLNEPEPVIGVSAHGESAMVIDALVWCHTDDYYTGKYYLMEKAKLAFDKANIEIPYPHIKILYDDSVSDKSEKGIEDAEK